MSKTEKIGVSIIIPTFNRAHLIVETIQTIIKQTYEEWECLIIDDGSTDNTMEIIEPFANKDQRFKIFSRSPDYLKGPSGCRNQGIDLSNGDYIIFFDSDDIVHPETLIICVNILENQPQLSFCRYEKKPFKGDWSNRKFEKKKNYDITPVSIIDIEDIVTNDLAFACCTVMWRRTALGEMRFDEKLSYAEEWEYYIRLLSKELKGVSMNLVLYYNRKHSHSNTGEFWAHNEIRRISNSEAVLKTLETLNKNNLLSDYLSMYFIRLSFFLKSKLVLLKVLSYSEKGMFYKYKYLAGFYLYPLLRPIFRFKGSLLSKL